MYRCQNSAAFRARIVWLTVGRHAASEAAIVEKMHEVIRQVAPDEAQRNAALGRAASVDSAAFELGTLLEGGPGWLLVLDDVWTSEQLYPFLRGGRRCARLVTTRNRTLLLGKGVRVRVDQMSREQARQVLQSGLPAMSEDLTGGLLDATGRWPLLLRLINKILLDAHDAGRDLSGYGRQLYERLRAGGPAAVDEIAGVNPAVLAVDVPLQRARAIEATMLASIGLLSAEERRLLLHLAVFAADQMVPVSLVARFWQATEKVDQMRVPLVCARLDELALIQLDPRGGGRVSVHEVVREYLRHLSRKDDDQALIRLNGLLLDEVAATGGRWWQLGDDDIYLWNNLIGHLIAAGRHAEAERVAGDSRWVAARLLRFGAAAPMTDLALIDTPAAERKRRALTRIAHLLTPTDPPESIVDVLHSRLSADPQWGRHILAAVAEPGRVRLVNGWPLPDLPDNALLRMLTGHTAPVTAIAVSPDQTWIATCAGDRSVRLWEVATGLQRAVLTGHREPLLAVAICPDGSWLAAGDQAGMVHLWDAVTGARRLAFRAHTAAVSALAVSWDAAQLATIGHDRTVRVWDAVTGGQRALLRTPHGWMRTVGAEADGKWLAVSSENSSVRVDGRATGQQRSMMQGYGGWRRAVAEDGPQSWAAAAGEDSRVRIWDVTDGQERVVVQGPAGRVSTIAVSPARGWLATGNHRGTVRVWDVLTGRQRAILRGHTASVSCIAAAADAALLVTGAQDGGVLVWDVATGRQRAAVHHPTGPVSAVAISRHGNWVLTAGGDAKVRLWDTAMGRHTRHSPSRHAAVRVVAADPGATWFAAAGSDGAIRLWDGRSGEQLASLQGHTAPITALAVSPDRSWLASGCAEGIIRLWDRQTHRQILSLPGHTGAISALQAAPDGSWLASCGHDKRVRLWTPDGDPQTILLRQGAILRQDSVPLCLTVRTDWLATGGTDGRIRLWRNTSRPGSWAAGPSRVSRRQRGPITALAAHSDGAWLVSAGQSEIRWWDTATGDPQSKVEALAGTVASMSISPDASMLALGIQDTLRVWDLHAAQPRPTAMMRVDGTVATCTWLDDNTVAAGGSAGIYTFSLTRP